jgi:hypothetical protein
VTITEVELGRRLHELANYAADTPSQAPVRLESRRRVVDRWVPAAVIVLVLGLVGSLVAVASGSRRHVVVRLGPLDVPQPRLLPKAPISGRSDVASAWTGRRWLIWGGLTANHVGSNTGAAFNPATNRWTTLSASPLTPRTSAVSAWTGTKWLIVGGTDARGSLRDGAVYDPAANRWAAMASAPVPPGFNAIALWTGQELIVVTGLNQDSGAEVYDPARDAWRVVASPPGDPTAPYNSAAWMGNRLAVLRSSRVPSVLSPPSGGAATPGSTPPTTGRPVSGAAAVSPPPTSPAVASGPMPDSGLFVAVYDPSTDLWSRLPNLGLTNGRVPSLEWTGSDLLALDAVGGPSFAYHPDTGTWTQLRSAPTLDFNLAPIDGPPVWTGSRAYYWAGGQVGRVYDSSKAAWFSFPAGGLARRSGAAVAWTGDALLAWGGFVNQQGSAGRDGIIYRVG